MIKLKPQNIHLGIDLDKDYSELNGGIITAVTEKRTVEEIDETASKLEGLA